MDPVRHLRISVASLITIIALGTLGYSIIEYWQPFDALYMTVITLATVGLGIIIVGIKQTDGQMLFNPPPASIIEPSSVLIVLGERPGINQLEKLAGGS